MRLVLLLLLTLIPWSVVVGQTSGLQLAYDSAVGASHFRRALEINQRLTASMPFGSRQWQALALDRIHFLSYLGRWQEALAVVDSLVGITTEDSVRRVAEDQAFHALSRAGRWPRALEYAREQHARATSCADSAQWQADLASATSQVGLLREALTHASLALDGPCGDSLGGHLFVAALAAGEAHLALGQRDSAMHFATIALSVANSKELGPRAIMDAASLIAQIAGCNGGLVQWADIRDALHPKLEESGDSIALYDLRSLDVLILMQLGVCYGGRDLTSDSLIARIEKLVELGEAIGHEPEQLLNTSMLRASVLVSDGSLEAAIRVLAEGAQAALGAGSGISPDGQVVLLYLLAQLETRVGHTLAAIESSQRALSIANTMGNRILRVLALYCHGDALLAAGYEVKAHEYLAEAEREVLSMGVDDFVSSLAETRSPILKSSDLASPARLWSEINISLSTIAGLSGDYQAAEARLQRAYRFSEAVGDMGARSRVLNALAALRYAQGDTVNAHLLLTEAWGNVPSLFDPYGYGGHRRAVSTIIGDLTADDTPRSKSAWAAADILLAQGLAETAPHLAAELHYFRAALLIHRYSWSGEDSLREAAIREARQSVSLLKDGPASLPLHIAYGALGRAYELPRVLPGEELVSSEEDIAEAIRYHRLAAQTAGDIGNSLLLAQSLGRLAVLEWQQRNISSADSAFMAALKAAEEARFSLVREDRVRSAFLATEPSSYLYRNAVRFYLSERPDRPWDALTVAELAKARGLSDLVLHRALGLGGHIDPVSRSAGRLGEISGDLAEQSEALERQRREMELNLTRAAEVDSALREMHKASLIATLSEDALAELASRPEVAVLSFFVDQDQQTIYAWLIDDGYCWAYVTVGFDAIVQRLNELVGRNDTVNRNRYGRSNRSGLRQQDSASRELFSLLVGGLDTLIARSSAKTLVVVPHEFLNTVPFAGLHIRDMRLGEHFSVVVLPALHLLAFGREELGAERLASSFLGVVDPSNSLPRAAPEVRNASSYFERVKILSDTAATEDAIYRAWHDATVMHFATHAVAIDTVPNAAYVSVAAGPASDGRLTVAEVLSTPELGVELVVLSACESGGGKMIEGEGVMGFGRAFLAAGAEAVLVTLWPVDDQVAEHFMSEFYESWRGRSVPIGEAFRLAQSATRSRYPDVRDWATFELIARVW